MRIPIRCLCGHVYKVRTKQPGRTVPCPVCGREYEQPDRDRGGEAVLVSSRQPQHAGAAAGSEAAAGVADSPSEPPVAGDSWQARFGSQARSTGKPAGGNGQETPPDDAVLLRLDPDESENGSRAGSSAGAKAPKGSDQPPAAGKAKAGKTKAEKGKAGRTRPEKRKAGKSGVADDASADGPGLIDDDAPKPKTGSPLTAAAAADFDDDPAHAEAQIEDPDHAATNGESDAEGDPDDSALVDAIAALEGDGSAITAPPALPNRRGIDPLYLAMGFGVLVVSVLAFIFLWVLVSSMLGGGRDSGWDLGTMAAGEAQQDGSSMSEQQRLGRGASGEGPGSGEAGAGSGAASAHGGTGGGRVGQGGQAGTAGSGQTTSDEGSRLEDRFEGRPTDPREVQRGEQATHSSRGEDDRDRPDTAGGSDYEELVDGLAIDVPDAKSLKSAMSPAGAGGAYGARGASGRDPSRLVDLGMNDRVRAAVFRGLNWLARTQEPDGRWDCTRWDGEKAFDTGVTGLAMLALLADGHTHVADTRHSAVVARAKDWLLQRQDEDGRFAQETFYEQGIAVMALCELYGMSGAPDLIEPCQAGVNVIVEAMNPSTGGYGYGGPGSDTSVTGFQVMALKSAKLAELEVPDEAIDKLIGFLDAATNDDGMVRYRLNSDARIAITGVGLMSRLFLGQSAENPMVQITAERVRQHGPEVEDEYYTYYATYGMFHMGQQYWPQWNSGFRDPVIEMQVTNNPGDPLYGSWDPVDTHGSKSGGRVYTTAMYLLALTVYYRFLPMYEVGP